MVDLSLLIRALQQSAKRLQIACATLLPLNFFGCSQPVFEHLRLKDFEEKVDRYFESKNLTDDLRVNEVCEGRLEGFCILSAYEERVTPDSDKVIAVNALLEKHQFVGREEYWHLIVKTSNGLRVARFNTAQVPLVSPRPAYDGKNCVATRSIIFSKKLVSTGGAPLIGGGPNTKIVINIQPGD